MGLTPAQLYSLTPVEFSRKLQGHSQRQKRNRTQLYDAARIISAMVLTGSTKTKRAIRPQEILKLEGDRATAPTLTKEQGEKLRKMIDEAQKKRIKK